MPYISTKSQGLESPSGNSKSKFQLTSKGLPCVLCGNTTGHCRSKQGINDLLHYCHNHNTKPNAPINGYHWTKGAGDWGIFSNEKPKYQGAQSKSKATGSTETEPAVSPAQRDSAFRAYTRDLKLHPDDRADLHRRGVSDEQITSWGVVSIEGKEPGYMVLCYSPEGLIVGSQWRLRNGLAARYKWVSWLGGGSKNGDELPLTVHRPIGVKASGIAICEGIGAKSFILAERSGMVSIGAGAANQFGGSPTHWTSYLSSLSAELNTKILNFYPDAGALQNPDVMRHYREWFKSVKALGYTVKVASWEGFHLKGPDLDVIMVEDFAKIEFITVEEFEAMAVDCGSIPEDGAIHDEFTRSLYTINEKGHSRFRSPVEIASSMANHWLDVWYDCHAEGYVEYDQGVWKPLDGIVMQNRITTALELTGIGFSTNIRNAVHDFLCGKKARQNWTEPSGFIPVRNGVLEVSTMTLLPHSLDYGFRWQLPYDYDPMATCAPIVDWLKFTQFEDEDRVQLLRAYLRASLTGQSGLQRFLEVVSTAGGSGKSTYCNLAIALVGVDNVHITDSHRLEQSRFETACFRHKKLIYFADSGRYSSDKAIDVLKRITGGDTLPYERKNKDAREPFVCKAMVLIAANHPLNTSDPAIPRRRITVPFLRAINSRDHRELMEIDTDTKMTSGEFAPYLPGLLNWVMAQPESEMRRYLKDTDRAVPSLNEVKSETLIATSSLAAWFDECCLFADGAKTHIGKAPNYIELVKHSDTYSESRKMLEGTNDYLFANYLQFCAETARKPEGLQQFSEKLTNLCANILENPNVAKKRDAKGWHLTGVLLRRGDTTHPRPISDGSDHQPPPKTDDKVSAQSHETPITAPGWTAGSIQEVRASVLNNPGKVDQAREHVPKELWSQVGISA